MKLILLAYFCFTFLFLYQISIYSIYDSTNDVLDANEYNEEHGVSFDELNVYQNDPNPNPNPSPNPSSSNPYTNRLMQYASEFTKQNNYQQNVEVVDQKQMYQNIPTKNKTKTFSFGDIAKSFKRN